MPNLNQLTYYVEDSVQVQNWKLTTGKLCGGGIFIVYHTNGNTCVDLFTTGNSAVCAL